MCAAHATDPPRTAPTRRQDLPHEQLVADVAGRGPAVVLHPSLGRPGSDFRDLGDRLERAGFMAVMMNPLGIAGNGGRLDGSTLHDLAADLWAVADAVGAAQAHLVGHAFGNRVVRCAATDRPDRAASITLLAAGGRVPAEPDAAAALLECFRPDATPAERVRAARTAFFAPGNDAAVWSDGWFHEAARAQGDAGRRTPVEEWWGGGTAPMLVVQGLQDRIAPPQNGRLLIEERPGSSLVEIDGAGHALLPERPEEVGNALIHFLRALPAG